MISSTLVVFLAVLERKQALEVVTGGNGLEANRALGRLTELPPVPAS